MSHRQPAAPTSPHRLDERAEEKGGLGRDYTAGPVASERMTMAAQALPSALLPKVREWNSTFIQVLQRHFAESSLTALPGVRPELPDTLNCLLRGEGLYPKLPTWGAGSILLILPLSPIG